MKIKKIWNIVFSIVGDTNYPDIVYKSSSKYQYPNLNFYLKLDEGLEIIENIKEINGFFRKLSSLKYCFVYLIYLILVSSLSIRVFAYSRNIYLNNYHLIQIVSFPLIYIIIISKLWEFAGEHLCGFTTNLCVIESAYIYFLMENLNRSDKKDIEIKDRILRLAKLTKRIPIDCTNFPFIEADLRVLYIYHTISLELQIIALDWEQKEEKRRITALFKELSILYIGGYFGSVYEKLTGKSPY